MTKLSAMVRRAGRMGRAKSALAGALILTGLVVIVISVSGGDDRKGEQKIGLREVRQLLRHLGGADFGDEQIEIRKIGSGMAGDVVVEARIETAYRLAKEKDHWKVAEIRLGDRHWESMDLIEEAVRREKIRRTRVIIEQLAAGIAGYREAEGRFVEADSVVGLLDVLSPRYISFPHRLDLWGTQILYEGTATKYTLRSAGPDRKAGTEDDLVAEGRIG